MHCEQKHDIRLNFLLPSGWGLTPVFLRIWIWNCVYHPLFCIGVIWWRKHENLQIPLQSQVTGILLTCPCWDSNSGSGERQWYLLKSTCFKRISLIWPLLSVILIFSLNSTPSIPEYVWFFGYQFVTLICWGLGERDWMPCIAMDN